MTQVAEEKVMAPELRFPEYSGSWKSSILEDYCKRISVGLATSVTQYYRETGIPIVRNLNIKDGYFDGNDMLYLCEEFAQANLSKAAKGLDVITVHTGSNLGQTCVLPREFHNCQTFTTLITTPKEGVLDSYFLCVHMSSYRGRKEMGRLQVGGGKGNLNTGDLKKYRISIPEIKEQQKIASFLTVVDDKIIQLRRKRDCLKIFKRGVMQKIFSQGIRFTQDNGSAFPDWEEKKIGELFDWIRTNSLSREKLTNEKANIQNIHYGDIHTKFDSHFYQNVAGAPYVKPEEESFAEGDFCKEGDLVIADASEDYEDIGKTIEIMDAEDKTLVAGLHTYIARPKLEFSPGFAGYIFHEFNVRKSIKRIAQGISVLGISKTNLEKLDLPYPTLKEQKKIADFLLFIDEKISAVENKISQFELFKKSLLQKMFV